MPSLGVVVAAAHQRFRAPCQPRRRYGLLLCAPSAALDLAVRDLQVLERRPARQRMLVLFTDVGVNRGPHLG